MSRVPGAARSRGNRRAFVRNAFDAVLRTGGVQRHPWPRAQAASFSGAGIQANDRPIFQVPAGLESGLTAEAMTADTGITVDAVRVDEAHRHGRLAEAVDVVRDT